MASAVHVRQLQMAKGLLAWVFEADERAVNFRHWGSLSLLYCLYRGSHLFHGEEEDGGGGRT